MDPFKKQQRKVHPKETANIFSTITFYYVLNLFTKGFKQEIEEEDLYQVPLQLRSRKLGLYLEQKWEEEKSSTKYPNVLRFLWCSYGLCYIGLGLINLLATSLLILIQPYALSKLIWCISSSHNDQKKYSYLYMALVIGFSLLQNLYTHNYSLFLKGFAIKVRTALCSFIYEKLLKVDYDRLEKISTGNIITLITKDTQTIESFIYFGNELWAGPIKLAVICYVLHKKIGLASLAGVASLLITFPLQIFLASYITALKTKVLKNSDDRLQFLQEVLSGMRAIKIHNWQNVFETKISNIRRDEVQATYKIHVLEFIGVTFSGLNSKIALYILVTTYVWLGNEISPETVYFIVTCFTLVSDSTNVHFPMAIHKTGEIIPVFKRIEQIIEITETSTHEEKCDLKFGSRISLNHLTVSIKTEKIPEIKLKIEKGLTFITGSTGSGKSFLLKKLLHNFKADKESTFTETGVSYASQKPWIFPSTIRQNILFGEKYDEKRYCEVLRITNLINDLNLFDNGDLTILGDGGNGLGKEQKVKIHLARAVYKKCDIYLLDDCLAALKKHTSAFIFKECVLNFLKDKLVVMITCNSSYHKSGDRIFFIQKGHKISNVVPSKENSDRLLNNFGMNECTTFSSTLTGKENAVTEQTKLICETATKENFYHEEKKSGEVSITVYRKYISLGGGLFVLLTVFASFILSQLVINYANQLLNAWIEYEENTPNFTLYKSINITVYEKLREEHSEILYLYSLLAAGAAGITLVRYFALCLFIKKVISNIHKNLIGNILNTHMKFFDTHFIGNILNRFSKDFVTTDEIIIFTFDGCIQAFLKLAGVMTVTAFISPLLLLPVLFFFIIVILLRKFCIRTSRSLKRLEATTRGSIIGYLNETIKGLPTIRALKVEENLKSEFFSHLDLHTSADYTYECTMEAFGFVTNIICTIYIAIVILIFLTNGTRNHETGYVEFALSQMFLLKIYLHHGIYQWTEIENQMTSVERILEYTEEKRENNGGFVLENWPLNGEITYRSRWFDNSEDENVPSKEVYFCTKSQDKIEIINMANDDKLSFLSALFRLHDFKNATVAIDDVDIKTLSLTFLRSKISMTPEDPFLFTGSIRENIDPTNECTDEELWRFIEALNLKDCISTLDGKIINGISLFSVGQEQLISLAQVLGKKNKIVILEEMEIDAETKSLIHESIEKSFEKFTVIMFSENTNDLIKSRRILDFDQNVG